MLINIKAIIRYFRPNMTKVLNQFEKAIANLEKVQADAVEDEREAVATIAAAEARREAASLTAQRAQTVKGNLRNLIGE